MEPVRRRARGPIAVAVLLIAVLLSACAGSGATDSGPDAPAAGGALPQEGSLPEQGTDATGDEERMVIRTKVLRLEVDSTSEAIIEVRDLTRSHAGTVESMQVATAGDEWVYRYDEGGDGTALRGWITVRVPTAGYEAFVAEVAGIGKVIYQAESSEDVTQQHVDLSARLENLRAQEQQLRQFFEAAEDVDDMLAVEKELGRIRGEIESMDAQVTWLERQASMATVTLELTEPRTVVSPDGRSWGFVDAVTDGIRGAAAVLTGLITVVIASSPVWLVALLAFFPIRAAVRRRRAGGRQASATTEPEEAEEPRE